MAIRIYNTLTREKQVLEPVEPGRVKIYLCGPTVYMESHIGHTVGPIIFDSLKRYLNFRGYDVTLVVNITDVDDKIIKRAAELGISPAELAREVTEDYLDILGRLGIDTVDHFPRVTEHIQDIVAFIQRIMDRGFAYVVDGDVYFSVSKKSDYGKLSGRSVEEMLAGARVEVDPRKKDPMDFALWKSAKPGEPSWESPWGKGRPGWHIECSVMSTKLMGETFDIHGGGMDLIFPHHENEIAQSEAATGKPPARIWMHNGWLTVDQEKMSKSVGNIVPIRDLLDKHSYDPEAIRLFVLSTHYRRPVDFSFGALQEAERARDAFYRFFERVERLIGRGIADEDLPGEPPDTEFGQLLRRGREEFIAALDDDFNTARAKGILFKILSGANAHLDSNDGDRGRLGNEALAAVSLIKECGGAFGLFRGGLKRREEFSDIEKGLIKVLVNLRDEARRRKDFVQADSIRKELMNHGIALEDGPEGTAWRKI